MSMCGPDCQCGNLLKGIDLSQFYKKSKGAVTPYQSPKPVGMDRKEWRKQQRKLNKIKLK